MYLPIFIFLDEKSVINFIFTLRTEKLIVIHIAPQEITHSRGVFRAVAQMAFSITSVW